jgi:hypothetical protein
MFWLIAAAAVAVSYFVLQGFRTRCPRCGVMALHPRDQKAEKELLANYELLKSSGLLETLEERGSEIPQAARPGYENARFNCKSCSAAFDRASSLRWLTLANKTTEADSIRLYKEMVAPKKRAGDDD